MTLKVWVAVIICIIMLQINVPILYVAADTVLPSESPSVITDQKASWPMNEGSGSLIYDASGNGITGTLTNSPSWVGCRVGSALSFDGVNDYIACGDTLTGTIFTSLTVQAWIKPSESTGPRYIFYDGSDGEFALWQNEVHCGITVKLNGVAEKWVTAFNSIEYHKWQLVTAAFTGSELQIYVNGNLRNKTTVPANGLYNPGGTFDPTIGAWTASISNHLYYFKGALDDVNVWNRVLTAAEISNEFNTTWQNYYEPGGPIWINSNYDFNAAHGVSGGNGSTASPWLIENKNIDGTGFCSCIYIGNTTQPFIIKNSMIQNTRGNSWENNTDDLCLYLNNVSTAYIENVTISNANISICLANSNNITIANCTSIGNDWGIYLDNNSCNNILKANTLKNGADKGVTIYRGSNNNILTESLIENFSVVGVYSDFSDYNTINNNTITLCSNYGVDLCGGVNNQVYHNNFINNNIDGIGTGLWDNGYPSCGNYWDDYVGNDLYSSINQDIPPPDGIGDAPHIFGSEQDNYPYITPNGWYSPPIVMDNTTGGIFEDWEFTSPTTFAMDVSPEGEYAVIGDINGNLILFHAESSIPVWSLNIGTTIQNVSIAENGNYIGVIVDNKPQVYSRYGDVVFSGMEMGEIESTIDLTWEGKHAFVGYTNTMNMDLWRMAGGVSQIRCQGGNILPSIPRMSGSGNYVSYFYPSSNRVPVWNGTTVLEPQTLGGWQNPLFTFIDPLGNINDIAMSYDGNTIVAGSSSSDYGIINKTGWYWYTSAPASIIDIDISNDGKTIIALDSSGNLQIVYKNKTVKSIIGTFSNAELTGDGNHIVCSDITGISGLSIYDRNLNLVEHNSTLGNYDVGTLFVGDNWRHVWGMNGLTLHHVELMPHVNLTYTSEYFSAGYEHVNETTPFILSGYSVGADYEIKYSLDERGWVEYSGPFNLTGLLPGLHTIEYYIQDSEGYQTEIYQVSIWLDSYGFYSDTEARLTYLETQISNIWAAINAINTTILTLNNSISSIAYNLSQHWNFTGNMTFINPLTITNLQDNVTAIWENITSENSDQLNLWNNITKMILRINALELNDTYSIENITNLNNDLALLETTLISHSDNLATLTERITSIEMNSTLLNQQLNQTSWALFNTTTSLHIAETQIAQINTDLALLEGEVDANADAINHAETTVNMNTAIAVTALILGIIGLLLGLLSFRRQKSH